MDKNSVASLMAIELSPQSSTPGNGGYIDFHYNGSSADYTSRIIEDSSGDVVINGISITGLSSKTEIQVHSASGTTDSYSAILSGINTVGKKILNVIPTINNCNCSIVNNDTTIYLVWRGVDGNLVGSGVSVSADIYYVNQ